MKKSSSKTKTNSKQTVCHASKNYKLNVVGPKNNKSTATVLHTDSEHTHQNTTKKNSHSSISQHGQYLNRVGSCAKISNSENTLHLKNNYSKANILKIDQSRSIRGQTLTSGNVSSRKAPTSHSKVITTQKQILRESTKCQAESYELVHIRNQSLVKQNIALREECLMLHENQIKNKQKIQSLISRISEFKRKQTQTQDSQQTSLRDSKKSENKLQAKPEAKPTCTNSQCLEKRRKLQQQVYFQRLKVEELEGQKMKWEGTKQQLKQQYKGLLNQIKKMRAE